MDILYVGVCLFFFTLVILYIREKRKYIKERKGNTEIRNPINTAMLMKGYVVVLALLVLILYFLFRR